MRIHLRNYPVTETVKSEDMVFYDEKGNPVSHRLRDLEGCLIAILEKAEGKCGEYSCFNRNQYNEPLELGNVELPYGTRTLENYIIYIKSAISVHNELLALRKKHKKSTKK